MAAFGPDASQGDLLSWIFTYAWDQDMSQEVLFDADHDVNGVTLEDAKSTILEIIAGIRRKLVGPPKGQVVSMIMHNSILDVFKDGEGRASAAVEESTSDLASEAFTFLTNPATVEPRIRVAPSYLGASLHHPCGASAITLVMLLTQQKVWYPLFALGIIGSGAVYSGANPAYTSDELLHYLEAVRPTIIVTEIELLEKLRPALDALGFPSDRVFVDKSHRAERYPDDTLPEHDFHTHADLLFQGDAHWFLFETDEDATHYPAALFATSGTTGHPKYAVKTHRNLINDSVCIVERKPYKVHRLISLPLFHAFASPLGIVDAIAKAIPTYIMRRFEMNQFLDILTRHDITETVVVPKLVKLFTTLPADKRLPLAKLQTVTCAGAPLARALQKEGQRLLAPGGRLVQCWGMTETGWITTFLYPETDKTGSVGKLLPFVEVAVLDSQNNLITDEKIPGELLVRSPSVMKGYHNDRAATQQSKIFLCDGPEWLRTGDLGFMRNGKVYITGRIKELMKINGWQVSPAEIEDVLAAHPMIKDCGVVGITPPHSMNEKVYIRVVITEDISRREISTDAIRKYLLAHLAGYKVKDANIAFTADIPRNASGKIIRKELVDLIRKEQSTFSGGMRRVRHYCTIL